jgi:hypothetical protein
MGVMLAARDRATVVFLAAALALAGLHCQSLAGLSSGADAGAEASGGDARAPGWCQRRDADDLCDDFDEAPLGQRWTSLQLLDGGTMSLDEDASFSPPSSLLATAPVNGASASMVKVLKGGTLVHCELELLVGQVPDNIVVFWLYVSSPGMRDERIYFATGSASSTLGEEWVAEGGLVTHDHAVGVVVPGQWTHVSLDVTLPSTGDGGAFQLSLNDGGVVEGPLNSPRGVTSEIAELSVSSAGMLDSVRFDNVACDVTP